MGKFFMLYSILPQSGEMLASVAPELHNVLRTLLFQRGIVTKNDVAEFLNPRYENQAYDPFKFQEMRKAVERLYKAADSNERVIIYGDYDVDGVCSAILMTEALEVLYEGRPVPHPISVYLPHREDEGYGLNAGAVSYIKSQGASLVITCDCGSGNINELTDLQAAGIDTIVLDHHVAPETHPPCCAFINPKFKDETYPYRGLAASGVVFKVIQALRPRVGESFEKWSLDLVALATVADMMPLSNENRTLVKWGLVVLNKTRRVGLQALIHVSRVQQTISAYDISYMIAPRINSAGRLDHANIAFDLLRQTDSAKAEKEAANLNKTNEARQKLTDAISADVRRQVLSQYEHHDRMLVAYNLEKNWPMGVLGLVAGKIAKEYYRPCFVIAETNHGLSGSGRSIPSFDLTALLEHVRDFLEKYGGHPQACGFTFKKTDDPKAVVLLFKRRVEEYAHVHLSDRDLAPTIAVSAELSFSDITMDLISQLERLEPFGQDNPVPLFLTRAVRVLSCRLMGKNNNHCKLKVSSDGVICEAVAFCASNHVKEIAAGNQCDLIYTLGANEWNGKKRIQLMVKELIPILEPQG